MPLSPRLILALALAALAPAASAQSSRPANAQPQESQAGDSSQSRPADLRLDVDRLVVDSLRVTADSLRARLDLDASVGGLLTIRARLTVEIDGAEVEARGVEAAAELQVQLETVAEVLMEALRVIRENPDLVRRAAPTGGADGDVPPGTPPAGGQRP